MPLYRQVLPKQVGCAVIRKSPLRQTFWRHDQLAMVGRPHCANNIKLPLCHSPPQQRCRQHDAQWNPRNKQQYPASLLSLHDIITRIHEEGLPATISRIFDMRSTPISNKTAAMANHWTAYPICLADD